jgi:hypothetical protein
MSLNSACVVQTFQNRAYATDPPKAKKFDLPDEYTEEVFHSLANNPPVMQAMHNVIESFQRRGMKLDKEPSVTEMWKVMKDKDIIDSLNQCPSPSNVADSSGKSNQIVWN